MTLLNMTKDLIPGTSIMRKEKQQEDEKHGLDSTLCHQSDLYSTTVLPTSSSNALSPSTTRGASRVTVKSSCKPFAAN